MLPFAVPVGYFSLDQCVYVHYTHTHAHVRPHIGYIPKIVVINKHFHYVTRVYNLLLKTVIGPLV
jgi:hypothetical protein